jgi:hypothetical protein
MSGFEVAGVVLGSIPLVISTLEHYRDGLRTIQRWRKYERELQSLIRNLETERAKLQNVCEKLLVGLVPPSRIEAMVGDPMGDLWLEKDCQRKIRSRLWRSWSIFERNAECMRTAIDELMDKIGKSNDTETKVSHFYCAKGAPRLSLHSSQKIPWTDPATIARELRRASFTLNRSSYAELLATIRDGVSNLESLTTTNIELEPERKVRSRIRLLSILRDVSVSMYRAILASFRCTCNHGVSMRLAAWSADIIPSDEEEDIVRDIKFHLALSYQQGPQETSHLWEQVSVEPLPPVKPAPSPCPESRTTMSGPGAVGAKPAKRTPKMVKFSSLQSSVSSSSTTATLVQNNTVDANTTTHIATGLSGMTLTMMATSVPATPSSTPDLCGGIRKAQKRKEAHCYGMVLDKLASKTRCFNIHPYHAFQLPHNGVGSGSCKMISLRDILNQQGGIQPLTRRDRLQLAVYTASSVLQLYETPWLPGALTSDNIFFAAWDGYPYYGHAFIMANNGVCNAANPSTIIRNSTLLALGILLIEIICGKTLDALRTPEEKSTPGSNLLSDYMTARRQLGEIYQASSNYGSAVRRCIDGDFRRHKLDLGDEDFRQEVYSGVIVLLEEDLSHT